MSKVKVLVIRSKDGADIFIEDGGVASVFYSDASECGKFVTDYYQRRIIKPVKSFDKLWENLAEGSMYSHDWDNKKSVDKEIIDDAIGWLYSSVDEETETHTKFEIETITDKSNLTEQQLINKINMLIWRDKIHELARINAQEEIDNKQESVRKEFFN